MKIRLEGVALFAICAFAVHRLYLLQHVPPHHDATPTELLLGLIVFVAGVAGAAMTAVGPALFRAPEWPPKPRD